MKKKTNCSFSEELELVWPIKKESRCHCVTCSVIDSLSNCQIFRDVPEQRNSLLCIRWLQVTHTHTHIYTHTCTHTYKHKHTYIYIYIYTHVYIYIYTHTHKHTNTYTHTKTPICTHTYSSKGLGLENFLLASSQISLCYHSDTTLKHSRSVMLHIIEEISGSVN